MDLTTIVKCGRKGLTMTVKEFYDRMKLFKAENVNIYLPSDYDIVNMTSAHIDYDKTNNIIILSVPEEEDDE